MKSAVIKNLRHALLAMAGAALLAACGGGGGVLGGYTKLPIQGQLGVAVGNDQVANGLTSEGLVLVANGTEAIAPKANDKTFSFPTQVEIGKPYTVAIRTQPLHQTCVLSNPTDATGQTTTDTAGRTVSILIGVTCAQNSYTLGGTVTGLTGAGLVLTNGGDQVTLDAGASSFVFPNKVLDGAVYGVAVLTQPAGQTCSVVNGTAVMGTSAVNNVVVNCR
ncbi:MAG TPA: hypothetical protein VIT92_14345 [Burkholderiaceae bacterium]